MDMAVCRCNELRCTKVHRPVISQAKARNISRMQGRWKQGCRNGGGGIAKDLGCNLKHNLLLQKALYYYCFPKGKDCGCCGETHNIYRLWGNPIVIIGFSPKSVNITGFPTTSTIFPF